MLYIYFKEILLSLSGIPSKASTLPSIRLQDNQSSPRLPPQLPTNIFARDFTILAFDDKAQVIGLYRYCLLLIIND